MTSFHNVLLIPVYSIFRTHLLGSEEHISAKKCISLAPHLRKSLKIHLVMPEKFRFLHCNHQTFVNTKNVSRSTIFALSTPPGISAVAIIRISGPCASGALYKMGKFQNLPEPRKAVLAKIRDPVSGEILDKALVIWFPSPNSFTGEDMCELHIHGGIAVVKSVLRALMAMQYFRMAEPGEFTKRAFMANKLDLTEVEGLADLLQAETEAQQKQALRQMDGMLNKLYSDWSSRIKKCLANIEAYIDFSEDQHLDEVILQSVQEDLNKLKKELKNHLSDYRRGERLRNGVNTVLIGRPNVGKSSLLNSLCQRDLAIVSPTAGTTRDIIETSFNLGGYLVNISDTAGIRQTRDEVEMEGVTRAKDRSSKADLLLFILEAKRVLDVTESTTLTNKDFVNQLLTLELGEDFIDAVKNLIPRDENSNEQSSRDSHKVILLLNKIDLLTDEDKEKVFQLENSISTICALSCTEGTGMEKFLSIFANRVKEMCSSVSGEEPTITQERHRVYISNCLQCILEYEIYVPIDIAIAAEKLRVAMVELGKITGKVRVDDILDIVFKEFCIGK